jgi:hypothetical protein
MSNCGPFPLIVNFQDCSKDDDPLSPEHGWKFSVPLLGKETEWNYWTSKHDRAEAFHEFGDYIRDYIMERNPFPPQDEPRLVWVPKGRTIRWVTHDFLAVEKS